MQPFSPNSSKFLLSVMFASLIYLSWPLSFWKKNASMQAFPLSQNTPKTKVGITIRVMMIFHRFTNNPTFTLCRLMFNFKRMRADVPPSVSLDLFLNLACFTKFSHHVRDTNIGDKATSTIKVTDWEFTEPIAI